MKQHILFFDIDGTLFDCPHGMPHISDELKEAFKQLKANGHLCFVASGRPYAYLNDEIKQLGFDGFVLCNGALVWMNGMKLIAHYIEPKVVKDLVALFEANDCMYCLDDLDIAYCPGRFQAMYDVLESFQVPLTSISSNFDLDQIQVAKMEVYAPHETAKKAIRALADHGFELIDYADSGNYEINVGGVSKGQTILEVLDRLQIPKAQSIAFGDGSNDIEMLQVVGHGVAMGNAQKEVKAVADTVTETCVNHGIVRELQRLGLVEHIIA